jgi:molybdate transport system substrate-binding protein
MALPVCPQDTNNTEGFMTILALVVALFCTILRVEAAERVTIYAAASLASALQDLASTAKAQDLDLRLSFGSSSTLAKQVVQGAPAEVYFSANVEWMDYLDKQGLIEPGTRINLLGNTLVIIAPKGETFPVRPEKGFDFAGAFTGRLALGDPSHVPAGIYAKQALQTLGWWQALADRLAPAVDVRAALAYVQRGECKAGIVYATDAAISTAIDVLATLPPESHAPIIYPVAVIKGRQNPAVQKTLTLLQAKPAAETFQRYGFRVIK